MEDEPPPPGHQWTLVYDPVVGAVIKVATPETNFASSPPKPLVPKKRSRRASARAAPIVEDYVAEDDGDDYEELPARRKGAKRGPYRRKGRALPLPSVGQLSDAEACESRELGDWAASVVPWQLLQRLWPDNRAA